MPQSDSSFAAPFAAIAKLISRIIFLAIVVVVLLNAVPLALPRVLPVDSPEVGLPLSTYLKSIADVQNAVNTGLLALLREGWDVAKPALELLLILGVLVWAWQVTFKDRANNLNLQWDTRTMIGVVLIGTFCLATLINSSAANLLKDVVLVVVGFYFGTREAQPKQDAVSKGTTTEMPDKQ